MEDWDESWDVCSSLLNICFVFAHGLLQLYVNWVVLGHKAKMDASKASSNNLSMYPQSVWENTTKHFLILLSWTAWNIPVCVIMDLHSGPTVLSHPVFFSIRNGFLLALSAFWKLSKKCKIWRLCNMDLNLRRLRSNLVSCNLFKCIHNGKMPYL